MINPAHPPEIIYSATVLTPGDVSDVEVLKTGWAITIAVIALIIGFISLVLAVCFNRPDLLTWSTGLISAVTGSALTYGFATRGN